MLQGSSFCDRGRLNSRLLREAAFSWRPGTKALTWVKNITNFGRFCYLNIPCLRINITLILYEFFKLRIHTLVGKLKNRCFCWFPAAIFVPLKGTQTQSFKIWVNVFPNILHMKYRTDLILGEALWIFIFFYFLDSWLSVLNGLQLNFWLRDSENPQYYHFSCERVELIPRGFFLGTWNIPCVQRRSEHKTLVL